MDALNRSKGICDDIEEVAGVLCRYIRENNGKRLGHGTTFCLYVAWETEGIQYHNIYASTIPVSVGLDAYGFPAYIVGNSRAVAVDCPISREGLLEANIRHDLTRYLVDNPVMDGAVPISMKTSCGFDEHVCSSVLDEAYERTAWKRRRRSVSLSK